MRILRNIQKTRNIMAENGSKFGGEKKENPKLWNVVDESSQKNTLSLDV